AELFQKDVRTINEQLLTIVDERELNLEATLPLYRTRRIGPRKRHTATEIVHAFYSSKPFMGMQSTRPDGIVRNKADLDIRNFTETHTSRIAPYTTLLG
ncbi:MAG: hypothetical protein RL701_5116, partial [Pseudomonadota bacterium]